MALLLYNTLGHTKQRFSPHAGKTVSLYTCGPTVYNFAHIGNLRTYIFEDVLKRTLLLNDWRVKHVMNITDVGHLTDDQDQGEDKMEVGAQRERKTVWELAKFYTQAFQHDIEALNILGPTVWCKATDHISEQIRLIKKLEQKGYTYQINDGVYFDTSKFKQYGVLAQLDLAGLKAGARVEVVEGKKHPSDFALWKLSAPQGGHRQMEWPSPWGRGFPGWHIECSAMSMKYLKLPIDIHCGGIDHIPVHHTNEIAQSEAATGKRFVRFWLHGEHLTIRQGRMGKSEGNFLTLTSLIEQGFSPFAYRLMTYSAHYRTRMDFSMKGLQAAQQSYEHLCNALRKKGLYDSLPKKLSSPQTKQWQQRFLKAVNDDLNMPSAIAVVWDGLRAIHNATQLRSFIAYCDRVLALDLLTLPSTTIPEDIMKLSNQREEARKQKDWHISDALRKQIEKKGYRVEDSANGPRITKN